MAGVFVSAVPGGSVEALVIGVLGLGKLGTLLVERLIASGVDPSRIRIVARDSSRVRAEALKVTAVAPEEMGKIDILIVAVKANQFEEGWKSLKVEGDPIILSCMAKGLLATLAEVTQSTRIARFMTSTPCVIGKGIGAWIPGAEMSSDDRMLLRRFVLVFGRHLEAENEREIAFATTLSTVNGLVYLIIQYFREAMVHVGAPARYVNLIPDVIESALAYHRHRPGVHLVQLADDVTSPDGGTSAGRYEFGKGGIATTVIDAVASAYRKYTS